MPLLKTILFLLILGLLGVGLYNLRKENLALEHGIEELTASLSGVEEENKTLQDRISYFRIPENLVKELKSQFNYREADEELIIVVPKTNP